MNTVVRGTLRRWNDEYPTTAIWISPSNSYAYIAVDHFFFFSLILHNDRIWYSVTDILILMYLHALSDPWSSPGIRQALLCIVPRKQLTYSGDPDLDIRAFGHSTTHKEERCDVMGINSLSLINFIFRRIVPSTYIILNQLSSLSLDPDAPSPIFCIYTFIRTHIACCPWSKQYASYPTLTPYLIHKQSCTCKCTS